MTDFLITYIPIIIGIIYGCYFLVKHAPNNIQSNSSDNDYYRDICEKELLATQDLARIFEQTK